MARDNDDSAIRSALLYALQDDDPDSTNEPRASFKVQAKRYKETVREDLQNLLNTRQRCAPLPKEFSNVNRSVFEYGVPDVTGANLSTPDKREEFLKRIAAAITTHDARFQTVKVTSLENADPVDRTLRFRIEATLMVETGRETAVFDFQLEPVSRHFE